MTLARRCSLDAVQLRVGRRCRLHRAAPPEGDRRYGQRAVAAVDPHDTVGVIDRYFPDARFFTEVERFDRYLEKRRRASEAERVHYVTICSPNYLHDAHVRLALRVARTRSARSRS